MNRIIKPSLLLISVLFLLLAIRTEAKAQTARQCLLVSDIHLNPFYVRHKDEFRIDSGLVNALGNAKPDKWAGILDKYSKKSDVNDDLRNYDANYALLKWAIDSMAAKLPKPSFIVISGDFIWHQDVQVSRNGKTNDVNMSPYDAIVEQDSLKQKTIQFIAGLFAQKFPGIPIIPALGNNDSQGDYEMPAGYFLNAFANAWVQNNNQIAASSTFATGGYYTYEYKNDLKFVVLNTTVLSSKNAGKYTAIADSMFAWLNTELSATGRKIWIVSHILPGSDLQQSYTNELIGAVADSTHLPNISFYIAAHTHFNDFRVIYTHSSGGPHKACAYVRIVPSIGPNHGNNPSFIVANLDSNYDVTAETPYYLELEDSKWKSNYGIGTVGLPSVTAAGMLQYLEANKDSVTTSHPAAYIKFHSMDKVNRAGHRVTSALKDDLLKLNQ